MKIKESRKRLRLLAGVLGALLLIVLCGAFVLLIKVKGNISYLYNFMVATQGSLAAEMNPKALQGADADKPYAVESTQPEKYLKGTALQVDGVDVDLYQREQSLDFTVEENTNFTTWEGIITFRGNYQRSMQSYGTVSLTGELTSPHRPGCVPGSCSGCLHNMTCPIVAPARGINLEMSVNSLPSSPWDRGLGCHLACALMELLTVVARNGLGSYF